MSKIYGVGIKGDQRSKINGVPVPQYVRWLNMLRRCYCKKQLKKDPTYIGCSVSEEWLYYPNFKLWFDENHVKNYKIDKDLLFEGNKEYSPKSCRFVPHSLNCLFNTNENRRGKYKVGVTFNKGKRVFESNIRISGKTTYLGSSPTEEMASEKYLKKKKSYCTKKINDYYENGEIGRDMYLSLIRKVANL